MSLVIGGYLPLVVVFLVLNALQNSWPRVDQGIAKQATLTNGDDIPTSKTTLEQICSIGCHLAYREYREDDRVRSV